ncbi:MAG: polymer-forming cytoskeletal protein [Betaproteobacteria bacterium]|nr:polymer-forming cytoskeletal protein [Betaproteobacteria bacterium]
MFNKPGFGTRNDVVTRKEVRPVLGGPNASPPPSPDPTKTAAAQAIAGDSAAAPGATKTGTTLPAEATGHPSSEARLIVGPDVKLKGAEILDCDMLVVEGRVEATMDSRVIRIAEQGSFTGKVSIDVAEIHGCFEGELTARQQLIVHATGRVSGKIRYGKLVIDEGGELCGDINTLTEKTLPHRARSETTSVLSAVGG